MGTARKKILMIGAFVVGLFLFAGLLFFWVSRGTKNSASSRPDVTAPVTETVSPSKNYRLYEDPAGFSFKYPDNVAVEVQAFDSKTAYAKLEIVDKAISGSIKLSVNDSKLTKLTDWFEENNLDIADFKTSDKKLADLTALEARSADKLFLLALDGKVLFVLEVNLDQDRFWEKVYDQLLATFQLVLPKEDTAPANGASDDTSGIIFEGEEVVE